MYLFFLTDIFRKYGKIGNMDLRTNKGPPFAFLDFDDSRYGDRAIIFIFKTKWWHLFAFWNFAKKLNLFYAVCWWRRNKFVGWYVFVFFSETPRTRFTAVMATNMTGSRSGSSILVLSVMGTVEVAVEEVAAASGIVVEAAEVDMGIAIAGDMAVAVAGEEEVAATTAEFDVQSIVSWSLVSAAFIKKFRDIMSLFYEEKVTCTFTLVCDFI